jgi:hypothetical protein
MPELCIHCGELIDVEHQSHIAVYSDISDEPTARIIGFLHIKCSDELEATYSTKWRDRQLRADDQSK